MYVVFAGRLANGLYKDDKKIPKAFVKKAKELAVRIKADWKKKGIIKDDHQVPGPGPGPQGPGDGVPGGVPGAPEGRADS